jgi:hypothetical protein
MSYDIFLNLSRKSIHFQNDEYILDKWKTIKYKIYTIRTLNAWAKFDNPKEYNRLFKDENNKLLVDPIYINYRYLLDVNIVDNLLVSKTNEFFNDDKYKSLNICSPYNTGMTLYIKNVLDQFKPERILWVSYRVSLTNDIKFNFQSYGFQSYLTGNYKADKLIIQLESLHKLDGNYEFIDEGNGVPSYDLVIIDEIESILSQFNSPTFKMESREIFIYLQEIINNSKKLITLDGDISNRTYNFISNFGESINIVNLCKFDKKIFNIVDDTSYFENKIIESIDANLKIAIVSQSRKKAEDIGNMLLKKYPTKKIMVYTSLTDDILKMQLDNVNDVWIKADILIYSPTIEAGVNFDIPHFNKVFGILSNNSTSQRSFLQMMNRIRKITDNEHIILNDNIFKMNEIKNYVTFYDAKEAVKELNGFKMSTVYKTIDNKRVKIVDFDDYTNNYIYNKVEEYNKLPYYFLPILKGMVEHKGHEFKYNISDVITSNVTKQDKNNDDDNDLLKGKTVNELYDELLSCKLIKALEYGKLCRYKEQNKATREDKIKMKKYEFCRLLGLDELNSELIKTFYYGKHLMYNFINLIDDDNYRKTHDAQNIIYFEKLEFVHYLVKELGFINIFDSKNLINGKTLEEKFKNVYNNHSIYKNQKKFKINFNIPFIKLDGNTTIKQILGHLNSILINYSIKIKCVQTTINNKKVNSYSIEILNNVDELLQYKIKKGFNIIDKNNIFTCNKTNLKHLLIFDENSDDENE